MAWISPLNYYNEDDEWIQIAGGTSHDLSHAYDLSTTTGIFSGRIDLRVFPKEHSKFAFFFYACAGIAVTKIRCLCYGYLGYPCYIDLYTQDAAGVWTNRADDDWAVPNNHNAWIEKDLGGTFTIRGIGIRYYNDSNYNKNSQLQLLDISAFGVPIAATADCVVIAGYLESADAICNAYAFANVVDTVQDLDLDPEVNVEIDGIDHGNLVAIVTDEQLFGSQCMIEFDNSADYFSTKDLRSSDVVINWGLNGKISAASPPYIGKEHDFTSKEGVLRYRLHCTDIWDVLLNCCLWQNADALWNFPEQAPGEDLEDATHYNKTTKDILEAIITEAVDKDIVVDDALDDVIDTEYIPVDFSETDELNVATGIRTILERTACNLRWQSDGKFHLLNPDNHGVIHHFNAGNAFFINMEAGILVVPNKVTYCGTDSEENEIEASSTNQESFGKLGVWYERKEFNEYAKKDLLTTAAICSALAATHMKKLEQYAWVGTLFAPMHVSVRLLDKVMVTDDRYGTPRVTEGIVHRIVREYQTGYGSRKPMYRMTLYLGGTPEEVQAKAYVIGEINESGELIAIKEEEIAEIRRTLPILEPGMLPPIDYAGGMETQPYRGTKEYAEFFRISEASKGDVEQW